MLEHDAAIWPGPFDSASVDGDRSRSDRKKAAEHVKQRGLAASRRSEQRKKFPLPDLEGHIVDRKHGHGHASDDMYGSSGR